MSIRYKIGYIDEDPNQVKLYKRKLRVYGFEVIGYEFHKGMTIEELMEQVYSSNIDLLMIDFRLNESNVCTIAKPRPFRYPSKIRNVIKGRNLRRLTAARSEFAAAHSRLTICIAPSLNPDRSAIPQKSATFSNCKSAAHFRPPSTQLKPIFTFLKGEFEAAHSRKVGIYCSFQLQLFG